MKEKTCFKCGEIKSLDSFYRHPKMADGYLGKCKECAKADVNQNRAENREYYNEYDRNRFQNDMERRSLQLDRRREWAKNNPEKMAEFNQQWIARNQEKYHCHNVLNAAVRDGKLIKSTSCQECGISGVKIHGHHPDYAKPFDVMWLCPACHGRQHRLEREASRASIYAVAAKSEVSHVSR